MATTFWLPLRRLVQPSRWLRLEIHQTFLTLDRIGRRHRLMVPIYRFQASFDHEVVVCFLGKQMFVVCFLGELSLLFCLCFGLFVLAGHANLSFRSVCSPRAVPRVHWTGRQRSPIGLNPSDQSSQGTELRVFRFFCWSLPNFLRLANLVEGTMPTYQHL